MRIQLDLPDNDYAERAARKLRTMKIATRKLELELKRMEREKRRRGRKKLRLAVPRPFSLGQVALPAEMDVPSSREEGLVKVARLREGDGAWVRRSGEGDRWTYAVVKERGDTSLTFTVNERGSIKKFPSSHWHKLVRIVNEDSGEASSEERSDGPDTWDQTDGCDYDDYPHDDWDKSSSAPSLFSSYGNEAILQDKKLSGLSCGMKLEEELTAEKARKDEILFEKDSGPAARDQMTTSNYAHDDWDDSFSAPSLFSAYENEAVLRDSELSGLSLSHDKELKGDEKKEFEEENSKNEEGGAGTTEDLLKRLLALEDEKAEIFFTFEVMKAQGKHDKARANETERKASVSEPRRAARHRRAGRGAGTVFVHDEQAGYGKVKHTPFSSNSRPQNEPQKLLQSDPINPRVRMTEEADQIEVGTKADAKRPPTPTPPQEGPDEVPTSPLTKDIQGGVGVDAEMRSAGKESPGGDSLDGAGALPAHGRSNSLPYVLRRRRPGGGRTCRVPGPWPGDRVSWSANRPGGIDWGGVDRRQDLVKQESLNSALKWIHKGR